MTAFPNFRITNDARYFWFILFLSRIMFLAIAARQENCLHDFWIITVAFRHMERFLHAEYRRTALWILLAAQLDFTCMPCIWWFLHILCMCVAQTCCCFSFCDFRFCKVFLATWVFHARWIITHCFCWLRKLLNVRKACWITLQALSPFISCCWLK